MKLTRSQVIEFERADGTVIRAQPCSRGRMRDVLKLDLEPAEDQALRRGQVVAIYLQDAQWLQREGGASAGTLEALLDSLDATEEIDIIHAITLQHHGMDAKTAVELQQLMREVLKKKGVTTRRSN